MEKNKLIVTYVHEDISSIDSQKGNMFTNIGNRQIIFIQSKHIYDAGFEYNGIIPYDIPNLMQLCMEHYREIVTQNGTTGIRVTKLDDFRHPEIKKLIKNDQLTLNGKVINSLGEFEDMDTFMGKLHNELKNVKFEHIMIHTSPILMAKCYKFFSVTSEYDSIDDTSRKLMKRHRSGNVIKKDHYLRGDVYVKNPIIKSNRLNEGVDNKIWIGGKITCYFVKYTGKGYVHDNTTITQKDNKNGIVIPEFLCGEKYGELADIDPERYGSWHHIGEIISWDGKYGKDYLKKYSDQNSSIYDEKDINIGSNSELKINIYYN
jgi:hypothetical protein